MSKDINKRLSSETSQRALNQDVTQKVKLVGKERLLPAGEINHRLDVNEQFNKERQSGTKYRLITGIKPIFTNILFNMSGNNLYSPPGIGAGWEIFDKIEFKEDKFDFYGAPLTYPQSYRKHLKEVNGWVGYYDPEVVSDKTCIFFDMEPKRERLLFDDKDNWSLTITYPSSIDSEHTVVNDGLLIIGSVSVEVAKREMTAFSTLTKHGLTNGDTVRLTGLGGGLDGDYPVIITGLDDGSFKEHYFVVDIKPTLVTINQARMKRVFNGQESTYYFRKFKKVETTEGLTISDNDYDLFRLHMANTIYNDPTYQAVLTPDIEIGNIKDNLGRPITEMYYTLVKSSGGGFFTNIKSGIESEYVDGITDDDRLPDIRQITTTGGNTPLENTVAIGQTEFYGDVVEYNKFDVREKVIGEVHHRFNTANRESGGNSLAGGPRVEGYFYKAHHRIKLREWSNYVEQGDESVVGIPDYAEDLGDGRFLWRDLLDIGFNDGGNETLDYPFLNGCHYLYQDIILMLKRQDPYGQYGLYYNGDAPRDIVGDSISEDFKANKTDSIC